MSVVYRASVITIASGQTVSNAVDLGEGAVCGMQLPAALTGTAFTFQGSFDNVTFAPVTKVDGSDYTVVVAASKYMVIPPADLAGIRYLKVVSNGAEGAARNIVVVVRKV